MCCPDCLFEMAGMLYSVALQKELGIWKLGLHSKSQNCLCLVLCQNYLAMLAFLLLTVYIHQLILQVQKCRSVCTDLTVGMNVYSFVLRPTGIVCILSQEKLLDIRKKSDIFFYYPMQALEINSQVMTRSMIFYIENCLKQTGQSNKRKKVCLLNELFSDSMVLHALSLSRNSVRQGFTK